MPTEDSSHRHDSRVSFSPCTRFGHSTLFLVVFCPVYPSLSKKHLHTHPFLDLSPKSIPFSQAIKSVVIVLPYEFLGFPSVSSKEETSLGTTGIRNTPHHTKPELVTYRYWSGHIRIPASHTPRRVLGKPLTQPRSPATCFDQPSNSITFLVLAHQYSPCQLALCNSSAHLRTRQDQSAHSLPSTSHRSFRRRHSHSPFACHLLSFGRLVKKGLFLGRSTTLLAHPRLRASLLDHV